MTGPTGPTRRTALAGLAGAAAVLALDACTPSQRPARPTASLPSPAQTRPAGLAPLAKGFNISPRGADYAYDSPWTGLWSNWDWEGKVRRDIDLGIALGGTVVRIIGSPAGVLGGMLPQDVYFARMLQVIEYCRSRGVRFYAVGGSVRNWTPDTLPVQALQDHYVAQGALLEQHADTVFGFDLNNELMNAYKVFDGQSIRATLGGWARAVKAAAPSIRLTVSNYAPDFRGGYRAHPELEPALDYFDFHVARLFSARAIATWQAHKPVVLGEVQVRRDDIGRGDLYRTIVDAARSGGVGTVLTWDVASGDYGLYDGQGMHLDPVLSQQFAAITG